MSVDVDARNGHVQSEGLHFPAVKSHVFDRRVGGADDFGDARSVEDVLQDFHDKSSVMEA